jgi:putative flippase GtrA
MSKKTLFGIDYTDKEWIKIILYLFVGGTAALVEWAFFYGFNQGIGMEYMLATAAAFCLATLYHYFLGNILVFTSGARYEKGKELSLVFAVSIMGLAFNLILMYIFVGMMLLQPMFAKHKPALTAISSPVQIRYRLPANRTRSLLPLKKYDR